MSALDEGTDLAFLEDPHIEFVVGWAANEDKLAETKSRMASTEVQWYVREGKDAGGELISVLVRRGDPSQFDYLRRMRAMLREYGGLVVVAARFRKDVP